ncbi:MAG: extracellular solute-binding protein [Christensenellales bacterium]|jgi:putative aldouronate transport system substrate-binding protein
MKKTLSLLMALAMLLTFTASLAAEDRPHITITMFSMPANVSGLMENTWWTNYLKSELGITVELIPSGDNDDMQMQALLAADALPDIVIFEGETHLVNAIRANMLVNLDDHADKMPNAQKYLKSAMEYYAQNVSGDGVCYSLSNDVGPRPVASMLNFSTSLRWDLYKKIGMPEIKTVWDYLDVLKAMQDLNPTNEDGQKVYAITAWNDWDSYNMQNATQVSMLMGIDSGDQLGGKLPFATLDYGTNELGNGLEEGSGYIEGLKWFYTANQMGLLDPDSMTQTWNTALEKAAAGRLLFAWWSWAVGNYNTADRVNADEPTGFNVVIPTEARVPLFASSPVGSGWSWAISAKSPHIDRCIEYLDFMCNPDKVFVLANGPQGETWDIGEDGKPYITEKGYLVRSDGTLTLDEGGKIGDGLSVINSTPLSTGTISELYGSIIASGEWDTYVPQITKLQADWTAVTGYDRAIDKVLADGNYTTVPLATKLIGPLPDDMQIIATQIGDVVKTQSWLAVYAENDEEFNTIVAEMIATANELGLEEIMAYNQATWTAAMELAGNYE